MPTVCGLTSLGPYTYPISLSLCGFLLGSAPCPQTGLWPWTHPRALPERFHEVIRISELGVVERGDRALDPQPLGWLPARPQYCSFLSVGIERCILVFWGQNKATLFESLRQETRPLNSTEFTSDSDVG